MEKEVNRILERLSMQVISLDEARAEMRILGLFDVVGRSEQLCDHDFKPNGKGAQNCSKCGLPYAINC